jgi:hypothetical protein
MSKVLTGALHWHMAWSNPGEHTLYGLLSRSTEREQAFLTVEGDVTAKHGDDFHSVYVVKMDKEGIGVYPYSLYPTKSYHSTAVHLPRG